MLLQNKLGQNMVLQSIEVPCYKRKIVCAGVNSHYAVKLKNEVFPTVVKVDIPFYSDCREMFSEQKNNSAAEMF